MFCVSCYHVVMLSIIIPSRNEIFLQRTIQDIFEHAEGDIEVIAILDGYWPVPQLQDDPRLKLIHFGQAKGMRNGINAGVAIAKGEYVMKIDAHCMLDQGFDKKILAEYESGELSQQTITIPRRKRLDAEKWEVQDVGKPDVDYEFITNPVADDMHGAIWTQRALDRADVLIDDCPTFQGSCWIMPREYFYELELMDEEKYGMFYNEAQELSFKAWLSGGRVVTNKKTWYAHLHKGKKYGRGYSIGQGQRPIASEAMKSWVRNEGWHKQTLPFSHFVDVLFPNMPGWEGDWKEQLGYEDTLRKQD